MSAITRRLRRTRLTTTMRTDDEVAPKTTRRTSGRILAAGLVMMVVALVLLIAALQRQANHAASAADLTRDEVAQVRAYLTQRGEQRDSEREEVQAQLDAQARVLCLTIADLRSRAHDAQNRATLDRALRQLSCTRVVPGPGRRTPLATPGPATSAARPGTTTGATSRPRAAPRPSVSTTRPTTARPSTAATTQPTRQPPVARPAPTTSSSPGLVCGLLPLPILC